MHTKSFDSLKALFQKNPDVEIPVEEQREEEKREEEKRERRREEEPEELQEPATKTTAPLGLKPPK
jgi:hypothetical protein